MWALCRRRAPGQTVLRRTRTCETNSVNGNFYVGGFRLALFLHAPDQKMIPSSHPPPSSGANPPTPTSAARGSGGEQAATRYVVEEELATGGMGVVYRVR